MALPGTFVLNGITFDGVDDQNTRFSYQPNTINCGLEPQRSTYGTAQNPGVPSTVNPKRLWVMDGVLVPTASLATLKGMLESATAAYAFTDNLWATLITGSSYSTTVRVITDGNWLGRVWSDGSTTNQFEISLALWEV